MIGKMNKTKVTLIIITAIIITACSSHKKSTTTTTTTSTSSTSPSPNTPSTNSFAKRSTGIYAPVNEELTAIQVQYKDVTLDKLKDGYSIYTEGACINCHRAKNIYVHGESQWKTIIDDMALRANISDAQKDAVYKYVLAIKALQPK